MGLAVVLERHPNALLFGEDVAVKGGVYGVTRGLHARFGAGRVFDTLLDETSILGLALGAAVSGFLRSRRSSTSPCLHSTEDQLRGERSDAPVLLAAGVSQRNGGAHRGLRLPARVRGHFHNDDAVGVLRDIPGAVIASPARPDDAAAMPSRASRRHTSTDRSACTWSRSRSTTRATCTRRATTVGSRLSPMTVPVGSARTYLDGRDLDRDLGERAPAPLRVARRLATRGIRARVLDTLKLAPLPVEDILREANATGRVLVVDETRRTGGVSEGVIAELVDAGFDGRLARVTSKDSFVPLATQRGSFSFPRRRSKKPRSRSSRQSTSAGEEHELAAPRRRAAAAQR